MKKVKYCFLILWITIGVVLFATACSNDVKPEAENTVVSVISFNTNGGSAINPIEVENMSSFVFPSNPSKAGYTFINWYMNSNFETEATLEKLASIAIGENITLYAKWKINTYSVKFYDGETLLKTETVKYGDRAVAPIVEANGILIFNGWDKDFSKVTDDLMVKALYTKPIKSIAYQQGSMKENYFTNEKIDTFGGKIIVTFIDDSAEEVFVLPYMVTSFDSTTENNRLRAEIRYKNYQCEFYYSVSPSLDSLTVKSFELVAPNAKTEYLWGEELSFGDGAKIKVIYEGGIATFVSLSEVQISGASSATKVYFDGLDSKYSQLKISYKDLVTYFNYTVKKDFKKAELIGMPKTEYVWGETADLYGVQLSVTDLNDNVSLVNVTHNMLNLSTAPSYLSPSSYESGVFNSSASLMYRGVKVTEIYYTVKLPIKKLVLHKPFKVNYLWGESLDISGGQLEASYFDGTSAIIDISKDMVTGFTSKPSPEIVSAYNSNLQINYFNCRITIPYTVTTDVESFSIEQGTLCTNFKRGQSIDLAEQKTIMNVTYKSGKTARYYIITKITGGYLLFLENIFPVYMNYVFSYPAIGKNATERIPLTTETVAIYNFDTSKAGTFEMEIVYHLKVIKVQYTVE